MATEKPAELPKRTFKTTLIEATSAAFANWIQKSFGLKQENNEQVKPGRVANLARNVVSETINQPETLNVIRDHVTNEIATGLNDFTTQIRQSNAPLIADLANQVGPKGMTTFEYLSNKIINPEDGLFTRFFKSIGVRLLDLGCKIGGFVGAKLIDRWTGENNQQENATNLHRTFVGGAGMAFAAI